MSEQVKVYTPENVEFHYETADLGSRFMACAIDTLLISLLLLLVLCLFYVAILAMLFGIEDSQFWVIAGLLLVAFGILGGYFIYFESTWNGQTPGKRMVGLRVIDEDGYPITFLRAVTRNLVRLIDFLPVFYAVGLVVMFANGRAKRLGDYAAGTIVVKERRDISLRQVLAWELEQESIAGRPLPTRPDLSPVSREWAERFVQRRDNFSDDAYLELVERLAEHLAKDLNHPLGSEAPLIFVKRALGQEETGSETPRLPNVHRLTARERAIARAFLQRRTDMADGSRAQLANLLATAIGQRIEYNQPIDDPEAFLSQLLGQSRWLG